MLYYCDTDSLFCSKEVFNLLNNEIGKELG